MHVCILFKKLSLYSFNILWNVYLIDRKKCIAYGYDMRHWKLFRFSSDCHCQESCLVLGGRLSSPKQDALSIFSWFIDFHLFAEFCFCLVSKGMPPLAVKENIRLRFISFPISQSAIFNSYFTRRWIFDVIIVT